MRKRKQGDGLVQVVVLLTEVQRAELKMIAARDGVSLSEQTRCSLDLWIRAVAKNPHGARGLRGNQIAHNVKIGGWGPASGQPAASQTPPEDPWLTMPEPDQHNDPVTWSKWSAKQGNAAIARLAKGEWPTK